MLWQLKIFYFNNSGSQPFH